MKPPEVLRVREVVLPLRIERGQGQGKKLVELLHLELVNGRKAVPPHPGSTPLLRCGAREESWWGCQDALRTFEQITQLARRLASFVEGPRKTGTTLLHRRTDPTGPERPCPREVVSCRPTSCLRCAARGDSEFVIITRNMRTSLGLRNEFAGLLAGEFRRFLEEAALLRAVENHESGAGVGGFAGLEVAAELAKVKRTMGFGFVRHGQREALVTSRYTEAHK